MLAGPFPEGAQLTEPAILPHPMGPSFHSSLRGQPVSRLPLQTRGLIRPCHPIDLDLSKAHVYLDHKG